MDSTYREIDEAAECDVNRLFWRLISRRKCRKTNQISEILHDNRQCKSPKDISNAFADFYAGVYTPTENAKFVSDFKAYVTKFVDRTLESCAKYNGILPGGEINIVEIETAIRNLKLQKAPGYDKLQNEHVRYSGSKLQTVILRIFNAVIRFGRIPLCWKHGLLIPLYKGNGKCKLAPENYRPISLLPILYKLFETVLKKRLVTSLKNDLFPNLQQQGFLNGLSCITAPFNFQETIYYLLELGCKLFVAFLDSSRVFDTVWHSGLIYKLFRLGINSKALQVISDCYSDITSAVYVNEHVSVPFKVQQGVRQGGVLSTFLYLVYINDLLNELELVGTANISNIHTSNPSFADDVVCIGTSPQKLQILLNCAYDYSLRWRFEFNPLKSVILCYKNELEHVFNLGDNDVNILTETRNLGILRTVDLSPSSDIQLSCRKGQNAYFAIAGTGTCLLNPLTVCSLYNKIVIPSVLYGCELWNGLKMKDITSLETFQHFIVKHIQGLSRRTRSDMCESMINLERLPVLVEKRKLTFLCKLCEMKAESLTKQIFIYRLYQFFGDTCRKQYGFIPDVINILSKSF
ncbi:Hypothetical predicted protein [Mytilus galloprovincialis]|uniref:Reverse transcriptase domain-containing protein n=1 Tax=Mytilus galloprovincialis TaxID=29158 RepID=A0A8B6HPF8_MYTGA|nr:Hypothetical predicted protein [Mytilus galloprovincialis]